MESSCARNATTGVLSYVGGVIPANGEGVVGIMDAAISPDGKHVYAASSLTGNIDGTRTAGHFQYDPPFTPICVATGVLEGHHCPQRATEARQQILQFFSTALAGGAPTIVEPLP